MKFDEHAKMRTHHCSFLRNDLCVCRCGPSAVGWCGLK